MFTTYLFFVVATFFAGIIGALFRRLVSYAGGRMIGEYSDFDSALILEKIIRKDFSTLSDDQRLMRNRIGFYLQGGLLGFILIALIASPLVNQPVPFFATFFFITLAISTIIRMVTKIGLPFWKLPRRQTFTRLFETLIQSVFTILALLVFLRMLIIFN